MYRDVKASWLFFELEKVYRKSESEQKVVQRFLSLDPLADQFAGWTPYHYVHNNPLRFTDPTGMKADSTPIYNLSGAYQFTIPDDLPNESHFLSNSAISDLAGQCCSNANQEGEYARSVSNYFIGTNTRSQIKGIMDISISENKERGFVFHLLGKGKELSVLDITSKDIGRGENWFSMGNALDRNVPSSVSPLGTGHTHPYNPFASGPEQGSSWIDYAPNLTNRFTGKLGGNPFLIAHKSGIKVYSSAQRLDNPNYSLPSYYHYKYVGSRGSKPSISY